MATVASTATAPRILSWPGNSAPAAEEVLPVASATWKKGEFGYDDGSNTITPVTTTVVDAQYVFLDDRDTAANTTKARVQRLAAGTRILIRTSSSGADEIEGATCVRNGTYNVIAHGTQTHATVLDSAVSTANKFKVVQFGSELNEYEYTAALTPGFVVVEKLA